MTREKVAEKHEDPLVEYKREIGLFESLTLVFAVIGSLEFGATYTTLFTYMLMTVAFGEMTRLSRRRDKETHIQIKSKWIDSYFYFAYQFFMIPKTWASHELLTNSGIPIDKATEQYAIMYGYHNLISFCLITFGLILFVYSLQEGFYAY